MNLPATARGLILDMDGVLWKDSEPIGDLPRAFERIRELGLAFAMATNNSTRTVDQYVQKLHDLGVTVEPWQVITSSQAVAELVKKQIPSGSPIFAIGEKGLLDALENTGFELMSIKNAGEAQAVVMGIDRDVNFSKMVEAALLVNAGKPFFVTNPDKTFPTPRGEIPGAGAWISVIVTATGRQPIIAGKPSPFILEMALERIGTPKDATYVVGDRLETDIAGGKNLGCPTALVLSGVSSLAQAEAWDSSIDIISENLSTLLGIE